MFATTDSEAVGVADHSGTAASLAVGRCGEEMCLGVLESVTLSARFRLSKQVTAALTDWIYHVTGANEKVSCSRSLSSVFVIPMKFRKKLL